MERRELLTAAVGITVAFSGCTDDEPEETEDEVIDANPNDIIVTLDDLEAGWSGGVDEDEEGYAEFFQDDPLVIIEVDEYSDIESAESGFDTLKDEETEGTSAEDVEYGNEGFLVIPVDTYAVIGFRAGNFVIRVEAIVDEFSLEDPEDLARDFAEIIVDNIADIQD